MRRLADFKGPFVMKRILGDAKSVCSLLSQKYRIGYYQRDYKWEPKQIRELVEDLTTRFLQDFEPHHERSAVAQYGQYLLGSIIISEKNGERFIVDGQQRLTSLTLLLVYLDRLQRDRASDDQVDVANLIYSTKFGKKSFNLDVDERNACLQALIDSEIPDPTDQPPSVQNLINRFNDIADICPNELREEALPYFLDWLTENVMLVEITAFSDDDAYTIFETMNDRGLSLTPTDMLKGYLLASITDNESRAPRPKTPGSTRWPSCATSARTRTPTASRLGSAANMPTRSGNERQAHNPKTLTSRAPNSTAGCARTATGSASPTARVSRHLSRNIFGSTSELTPRPDTPPTTTPIGSPRSSSTPRTASPCNIR